MASENGNLNSENLLHVETTSSSGNAVIEGDPNISSVSSPSSSCSDPPELSSSEKDALNNASPLPDVADHPAEWSMISASPRTGKGVLPYTLAWSSVNASPRVSPPVQTLGKPSDYDPNRIPSSIFAPKSAAPMDWSVASNESLFSIHVGNSSFSRDYFIMFGKSGELSMLDELSCLPPTPPPGTETKPSVIAAQPRPSATVSKPSNYVKMANRMEGNGAKEKTSETLSVSPEKNVEDHSKGKIQPEGPRPEQVHPSVSLPRLSNESGNSGSSFAFPIFQSDVGKDGSLETVTLKQKSQLRSLLQMQPQLQPQTPEATPKVAETRWFSCFSYLCCCHSCSRGCCYWRCCR